MPTTLAVVVVVLVAIALARGPEKLDPDTPEGTVQEYLLALSDDRYEDAVGVLHPSWAEVCDVDDIRHMQSGEFTAKLGHQSTSSGFTEFGEQGFPPRPGLPDATLFVDVTITHGDGGFGGGWDEYVVFELVEEDGFYWLVGNPWPYFTWACEEGF